MRLNFPPWMENLAAPEGETSYLSVDDLQTLKASMRTRSLGVKQALFHEGDLPQGVYGVTGGSFYLSRLGSEGQVQIFDLALPGALLGLRALVSGEVYSASAVAREKSSVCFYEGTLFMKLLEEKPSLARAVLAKVGRQLREAREELVGRSVAGVSSRLAHWILHVEEMYRAQGPPSWISIQELAGMTGAAPETISRQMAKFQALAWIERKGRRFKVLNRTGLIKESAGFSEQADNSRGQR